jgi:hypothetical protein
VRTQAYGCKLNEGRAVRRGLGNNRVRDGVRPPVKATPPAPVAYTILLAKPFAAAEASSPCRISVCAALFESGPAGRRTSAAAGAPL